jgi:hypothetical protein
MPNLLHKLVIGCRFHLPEDAFHLPRAIGQPLMLNPGKAYLHEQLGIAYLTQLVRSGK